MTDHAREAVSYLLWKPPLPVAIRPAYGVLMAAGIGLMPRWTRRPLRLPSTPVTDRTVVKALGSLATGTIRWAMAPGARRPGNSGRQRPADKPVAAGG